jgi:hypothetical protein
MSNYSYLMKVRSVVFLKCTFVCHGFFYFSNQDQEFYQLLRYFHGFTRSMILLDQEASYLVRVGVRV